MVKMQYKAGSKIEKAEITKMTLVKIGEGVDKILSSSTFQSKVRPIKSSCDKNHVYLEVARAALWLSSAKFL